jgi:hypothetical protein
VDACYTTFLCRWENYLLTLVTILVLSLLLYFPSVLCSLLTLGAILVMGVGRYHGQTKTLVELRKAPPVELLDQDQHLLKKQHTEQEQMHKSRLEFRQILSNAENFMLGVEEKVLDYIYSIYLWKSPEVSLCVTVLLCLVLVLLCTIDLHTIGACIPAIVLCTNRHFFSRSIDLWKLLLRRLKDRFDRRRNRQRTETRVTAETTGSHEGVERDEEEEEEGDTEPGSVIKPALPEEQDSSNEAGLSDANHTPELRQRASQRGSQGRHTDSPTASGAVDTVSRSGEGVVDPEAGQGTLQSTKRDGKATQHELCSKCKTALFFLKRKHDCNMCGQTFCGSCTSKVKKAALGVTSPAAYETSVRVCLNCKAQLTKANPQSQS